MLPISFILPAQDACPDMYLNRGGRYRIINLAFSVKLAVAYGSLEMEQFRYRHSVQFRFGMEAGASHLLHGIKSQRTDANRNSDYSSHNTRNWNRRYHWAGRTFESEHSTGWPQQNIGHIS